jgi:dTDP-4-dehydrorhamnose reductase
VYARTKRAAEMLVLESGRGSVVRASLIYGHSPSPAKGVLGWMERAFKDRASLKLFYDEYRTPIHVQDLSAMLLMVSRLKLLGIWHCGGPERLSRVEFGEQVAEGLGYEKSLIVPTSRQDPAISPARPEDVSLNSAKLIDATGIIPLDVASALATYCEWR